MEKYIKNSIPLIIKDFPSKFLKFLDEKYSIENINNKKKNIIDIKEYIFPELSKELDSFISKYIKKNVLYMASFSGNYKSSYAHIDSFSSYNFYYVKEGIKEVYIIPHEHTKYLDMKKGIDNIYVGKDKEDLTSLKWLDKIPSYYHFNVKKGEILLFNNSKCIHKFVNVTGNKVIYTFRLFSVDASELVLKNDIFNWEQANYFSKIFKNGGIERKTFDI